MRVLWITNILFPEALKLLTGKGDLKASGGWMIGAANALIKQGNIDLYVASVSPLVKEITRLVGHNIKYYVLPMGKGNLSINSDYIPLWKNVNDEIKSDIVHIHGTEYSHGYAYMKACGINNVVISIQGLTSAYYNYYYYGITKREIFSNLTIRDILKGTIISGKKQFKKRGEYEIAMLRMAKYIIGRTTWDRVRSWAINPDAEYYFCNETLRPEFYDNSNWDYKKCIKHSIFISQAGYSIKGLHQVLKAMPLILRRYSDTTIRIAGINITKADKVKDKLRMTGYGMYIRRIIKKYHLEDKVVFTGNLDGEEMKKEYLRSNVFVCPSSIENSPNSLGEAQILGVPCVASYVGGVPDMMKGAEEYLYRFEEIEMLADKICMVFEFQNNCVNMREEACVRHSTILNAHRTLDIYCSIINKSINV